MIQLANATFGYHGHPVIHCQSLQILPGTCLGIYGANGSGKSTLLRGIAGALPPISGLRRRQPALILSLVPQRQAIDPAWPMTALDAAALALSAQSTLGWLGRRRRQIITAMAQLDIASLASRPFKELSGGQQQRVLLAGALACHPHVLLLDEPAEGLDAQSTAALLALLHRQVAAGAALVMISHEAGELAHVADSFAWVDVSASALEPNRLVLLSRSDFLRKAVGGNGNSPSTCHVPPQPSGAS
jgi:ABC-type Mn2+/Zn2+ transport system ATPase subunit